MKSAAMLGMAVLLASALQAHLPDAGGLAAPEMQGSYPRWHIGMGLHPGSSYEYQICDYESGFGDLGKCYNADLIFLGTASGPQGRVWLVQADITHGGAKDHTIFFANSRTFEAHAAYPSGKKYVDSIERTVFWPSGLATERSPKALVVGSSWGTVQSYLAAGSDMLVRQKASAADPLYEVGFSRAKMLLSPHLPFPAESEALRPAPSDRHAFTAKLVNYSAFGQPDGMLAGPPDPGAPAARGSGPAENKTSVQADLGAKAPDSGESVMARALQAIGAVLAELQRENMSAVRISADMQAGSEQGEITGALLSAYDEIIRGAGNSTAGNFTP